MHPLDGAVLKGTSTKQIKSNFMKRSDNSVHSLLIAFKSKWSEKFGDRLNVVPDMLSSACPLPLAISEANLNGLANMSYQSKA